MMKVLLAVETPDNKIFEISEVVYDISWTTTLLEQPGKLKFSVKSNVELLNTNISKSSDMEYLSGIPPINSTDKIYEDNIIKPNMVISIEDEEGYDITNENL